LRVDDFTANLHGVSLDAVNSPFTRQPRPFETSDPTPTVMATPIQPMVQEQTMAMYDDGSQQMEGDMMTEHDGEQYDDNYGGEYEGQYGDQSYDSGGQMSGDRMEAAGAAGADPNKVQCEICFKYIHKNTIYRHKKNQHGNSAPVQCNHCERMFKNETSHKDHLRNSHNIYQSNPLE